jgi:hypothetical protein
MATVGTSVDSLGADVLTTNVSHRARGVLPPISAILCCMLCRKRSGRWILLGAIAVLAAWPLFAKEARPPKWSRDVLDTFFDDAREKLEGERPDYGRRAETPGAGAASQRPADEHVDAALEWSRLISAEALETEIKRLAQSLDKSVTTPSGFKGGGFKAARRDLSELALLFAVTAEYEGDARWKDTAASLRDAFARAAANAKVGSDATYRESMARKQDLADLIRGGRPQVPKSNAAIDDWSKIAARPPLMQRLNIAHQERLTKWLADDATWRRHQTDAAYEAQIVALIAAVIHRQKYEYWDDETFAGYASDLQQAGSDVSAAAASNNYQQAREAIGRATNACANCHDGYRG